MPTDDYDIKLLPAEPILFPVTPYIVKFKSLHEDEYTYIKKQTKAFLITVSSIRRDNTLVSSALNPS